MSQNQKENNHVDEVRCCAVGVIFHVPKEVVEADMAALEKGEIENPTDSFPKQYKDLMELAAEIGKKHGCLAITPVSCSVDADAMFLWRSPEDEQKSLDFYHECRFHNIDARLVKKAVYVPSRLVKVHAA